MKNMFNTTQRAIFLFIFVMTLAGQILISPGLNQLYVDLDKTPPRMGTFMSFFSLAVMLVLGVIPINKSKYIKSKAQLGIVTFLISIALLALALIPSIILPIYQITAAL